MTDEQTQQRMEISRANEARLIVENPLVVEAFQVIRDRITEQTFSGASTQSSREELWRMRKAVDYVESHLQSVIETGRMASISEQQSRQVQEASMMAAEWNW